MIAVCDNNYAVTLIDFDNTENVASDQEIAKLNRHFQSVKQQIYNRPAHVLEEETE